MQELLVQHSKIAQRSLQLWGLDEASELLLLNYSENTTFRIITPTKDRYILRLCRFGHHSRRAIASELAWLTALNKDDILPTAKVIAGLNGDKIQEYVHTGNARYFLVLFEHLNGSEAKIEQDLTKPFHQLGIFAAKAHGHAQSWQMPKWFDRQVWDETTIFADDPVWGHWRNGPNVSADHCIILDRTEHLIRDKLQAYGKNTDNFGLIHSDMRLANLLVDQDKTYIIDFDDIGFGWWMYDFAAAISFFEDHPQIPTLKQSWLIGYQSQRPLSKQDIAMIDYIIMLRRLHLLGWLGTHADTEIAQELSADFADVTVKLARGLFDLIKTTR